MTTQLVTICSHNPTQPYYHYEDGFLGSLKKLGVEPVVLGFGEEWTGLINKPKRLRHWLRHVCEADVVIASDCFDVVYQETPDTIAAKWKELWPNGEIVFNAERSLFPRSDLAEFFPETGTPFRYLNSGFIIGGRDELLTMIESVDWDALGVDRRIEEVETIHYNGHIPFTGSTEKVYQHGEYYTPNDQGEYQEIWSRKPVPMELDGGAQLCMACHGAEIDDFDFTKESGVGNPKVKHLLPGTTPGVYHFNGDAKDKIMPRFLEFWNL